MKVIFNGTQIAADFADGGTDNVQGFTVDEAEQLVQEVARPRAKEMAYYPRGNRKRSISGTVTLAPSATLGAAMATRATLYDGLPSTGALVTVQGVNVTTWANAILRSYKRIKMGGVAHGFTLMFVPNGPAIETTLLTVLGTGSGGAVLGDGHGGKLGTGI